MKSKASVFKAKHDKYIASKKLKMSGKSISTGISGQAGGTKDDLNRIERISYRVLSLVGISLVSFSIIYLFFVFLPVIGQELSYLFTKKGTNSDVTLLTEAPVDDNQKTVDEAASFGLDPNFSIYVPKIDAKGNIAPNVDTSNEGEYLKILKNYVAHAKGSYFPGQGKMIYLFSHSTDSSLNAVRYNAVFYLLSELKVGDKIVIFFSNKKFVYEVNETTIISAYDTSFLDKDYNQETLVLQTCYPPGTTLKRFLVFANRLDN
jgi:LPXTG-site transpeptidase (sortase) family protein